MMGKSSAYRRQKREELWHGEQELRGDTIQTHFNGGLACFCVFAWFMNFTPMKDPFIWTLCNILRRSTWFSVETASVLQQGNTSKGLNSCEALWVSMHSNSCVISGSYYLSSGRMAENPQNLRSYSFHFIKLNSVEILDCYSTRHLSGLWSYVEHLLLFIWVSMLWKT